MIDIIQAENGSDLGIADTTVGKAGNVVSTQLGSLSYAPDFGVDLKYFLQEGVEFQNASFNAYLVERLTYSQINVSDVKELVDTFTQKFTFSVGDANENLKGLIV